MVREAARLANGNRVWRMIQEGWRLFCAAWSAEAQLPLSDVDKR
jgi:hypothetical protein